MAGYIPGEKIKIVPIISDVEKDDLIKDSNFEIIGLYVTDTEDGPKINIGYPSVATYNQALGNMFGFKRNHGMYFLTGDFPEVNDRPIYIISITNTLTVDSYSQTNIPIVGKHDLLEILSDQRTNNKKRANK
jgi:hypothetical protein